MNVHTIPPDDEIGRNDVRRPIEGIDGTLGLDAEDLDRREDGVATLTCDAIDRTLDAPADSHFVFVTDSQSLFEADDDIVVTIDGDRLIATADTELRPADGDFG